MKLAETTRGLKNYLSNRKQFIQINNEKNAELETIPCGILQGSILGHY